MKRYAMRPRSLLDSRSLEYNQGVLVEAGEKTLYISGQLGIDKEGNLVPGGFREQCARALEGVDAVLREAGGVARNVVKVTAYVTDMESALPLFIEACRSYFGGEAPALTLLEVQRLPVPKALIAIEATAVV